MSKLPDLTTNWESRRAELRDQLLAIEYGPLPPVPVVVTLEELNTHTVNRLGGARHSQYRVRAGDSQWVVDLLAPPGKGPRPIVLNGDGCWMYLTDALLAEILGRGYLLARFNRVEIMPDRPAPGRTGAIAAWAWGYHRCVDALQMLPEVDASRIAVVGHSRGGKAVLLAGATDERIALVGDNASGCCGAAPFRLPQPGSETLAVITDRFPHWFAPGLREYAGREQELPFDQHALLALVAPRPLLLTMALGDLWANPVGVWESYRAALPVWERHGVPKRMGIHYRPGTHEHHTTDWAAFLDFADWHLQGRTTTRRFDQPPLSQMPQA